MRPPNNFKKRKTSPKESVHNRNEVADNGVFTSKPTAVFTPSGGRDHTLSIAIPGSIVANAKSIEQKTLLAGIIARALAVFCVDEVIVFDDDEDSPQNNYYQQEDEWYDSPIAKTNDQLNGNVSSTQGYTAHSDPSHFLAHILSYLETPPYMRKHLFPMHPNLRGAGLLPSLDMPHHLRANEWCDYREGIVVSGADQYRPRRGSRNSSSPMSAPGSVVDIGLPQKVILPDIQLPQHARVTVRFWQDGSAQLAEPVHPSAPRSEAGYYWGYYVRRCPSLSSVFTECPFDGGYDMSFGTSERGAPLSTVLEDGKDDHEDVHYYRHHDDHHHHHNYNDYNDHHDHNDHHNNHNYHQNRDYKHLLLVFGGVAGLETAIRNDPQLRDMDIHPNEAGKLFDYWVNLLPGQGSRTIRTEEAIWLGLTSLRGLVEGSHRPKRSYRFNGSRSA